jgi:hypothetical protein
MVLDLPCGACVCCVVLSTTVWRECAVRFIYTGYIICIMYQSANKSICNNDTWWKLKIKKKYIFLISVQLETHSSS